MNLFSYARILIPICILFAVLDKYFLGKTYIFSPARLQQICQSSIAKYGNETELLMKDIIASLQTEYGDAILPWEGNSWVLNNAGGAMGAMMILHASLTEYLIFFGTPVATEGHTGVHLADDYFTIIKGEQRAFVAGELSARVPLYVD
jgi:C-8 sterol isomerase